MTCGGDTIRITHDGIAITDCDVGSISVDLARLLSSCRRATSSGGMKISGDDTEKTADYDIKRSTGAKIKTIGAST